MTADLQFFDNDQPPLPAGDYQITVTQSVALAPPNLSPLDYVHRQAFQVAGPHFGLGPDDVVSVFPPAASTADRHESLAHVVLRRPTLPWEIPLDPTMGDQTASADGTEAGAAAPDPLVAPWLAVLVLLTDEIAYPADAEATGNLTGTRVVALTDYLRPSPDVGGPPVIGPTFLPQQLARFEAEYPELRCTVVDVNAEAFNACAPRRDEVPYLAHAREVDTADQETDGATGWFGVAVGTRFPTASKTGLYVAHLVSLEGFQAVLPGTGSVPAGATVRLVSLFAWTFRSFAAGGNFEALAQGLDVAALRIPPPLVSLEPPHDGEEPVTLVLAALDGGYTAAPYRTRLGEATTAWYRGPCLPVQMLRNRQPSYPSAEAGLLYDASTGMFDVSFAVAWQVGRLLALADRDFAVALLGWLREVGSLSHLLADRLAFFARYDELAEPRTVGELLAPGTVRRALVHHLASTVAPSIVGDAEHSGALGPPRDPSELLGQRHRVPGVVGVAEVAGLLGPIVPGAPTLRADEGGVEAAVVDLVRSWFPVTRNDGHG